MELRMRGLVVILLCFLFTTATKFNCCDGHNPNALCREEEREALLSFKRGIHDPSNRLSSWANEDCCNWEGVHCHNTTGHVLELNLRWDPCQDHGFLGGEISSSLLDLKHLQYLDLSCNYFAGRRIPKFFGSLSNLRYLNLSNAGFGGVIPHQLGNLSRLHYLDIGNSYYYYRTSLNVEDLEWISGLTPLEFLDMANVNLSKASNWLQGSDSATVVMKGVEYEYGKTLGLLVGMDLSSNKLSGEIPEELTALHGLIFLNLSHNHLQGKIPVNIGAMTSLESLDLSMNRLSGVIPQGMATTSFLSHLNLSYNNFSGKIPSGTQIRGFSPLCFIGNPELCAAPLTDGCGEDSKPKDLIPDNDDEEDNGWIDMKWLYLGMPWGFAVGFWAILAPLAFNRAWRYAYFRSLDDLKYKLFGWCL